MVVLLGIGAIVVDLGMSWMLHRQEQNAADPGAIAAARWLRDPVTGATWSRTLPTSTPMRVCTRRRTASSKGTRAVRPHWPAGRWTSTHRRWAGPTRASLARSRSSSRPASIVLRRNLRERHGHRDDGRRRVKRRHELELQLARRAQADCSGGASGQVSGGATVRIFPVAGRRRRLRPCELRLRISFDDNCTNGSRRNGARHLRRPEDAIRVRRRELQVLRSGTERAPMRADHRTACLNEGANPLSDPLAPLPEPPLADFPNGICPNGTPSTPASTSACDSDRLSDCPLIEGEQHCSLPPGVYYGGWDVKSNVRVLLHDGHVHPRRRRDQAERKLRDHDRGQRDRLAGTRHDLLDRRSRVPGHRCPMPGIDHLYGKSGVQGSRHEQHDLRRLGPEHLHVEGSPALAGRHREQPDRAHQARRAGDLDPGGNDLRAAGRRADQRRHWDDRLQRNTTASCLSIQIISWTWNIDWQRPRRHAI